MWDGQFWTVAILSMLAIGSIVGVVVATAIAAVGTRAERMAPLSAGLVGAMTGVAALLVMDAFGPLSLSLQGTAVFAGISGVLAGGLVSVWRLATRRDRLVGGEAGRMVEGEVPADIGD